MLPAYALQENTIWWTWPVGWLRSGRWWTRARISLSTVMVLMIDEVDSAANNQVFLDFLVQMRNYYLEREAKGTVTFWSVILAGLYDVKSLKAKLRPEEARKTNSPWNTHGGNEPSESAFSFGDCPCNQMVQVGK